MCIYNVFIVNCYFYKYLQYQLMSIVFVILQFEIEGYIGSGYYSDIVIDDFFIIFGYCQIY